VVGPEQPVTVSRWSRTATGFTGVAVLTVVILAAVPYFAGGPAEQPLITLLTLVAMATMWNLLAGFSGLTSFGQQAYIGVGAYALYLVAPRGVNPFAAIVLAAIIATVISLPVSVLVLRLSGGYFAVATLVVAAVFQIVATLSPSVGGTTGVSVPGLAGYGPVLREALTYWATLAVAVVSVAGVYHPVQRGHAVHGAHRRDGHHRGPDARRAGAVRAAGDAVLLRRLVPGHRRRSRGDRHAGRLARALGSGQRPVRLVPAPGRLPGTSAARMTIYRP
jgi:hypothetical protein